MRVKLFTILMIAIALASFPSQAEAKTSRNIAVEELRDALLHKEDKITVTLDSKKKPTEETLKKIFGKALENTGKGKEGDYIRNGINSYSGHGDIYVKDGNYHTVITYRVAYYTKKSDLEEYLPESKTICTKKTVKGKVKQIADFIADLFDYDSNHMAKSAAPEEAVRTGKAICNAYACTFYYIATEAGLDCNIAIGQVDTSEGKVLHAWNTITTDKETFAVDPTWYDASGDEGFLHMDQKRTGKDPCSKKRKSQKN